MRATAKKNCPRRAGAENFAADAFDEAHSLFAFGSTASSGARDMIDAGGSPAG